MATADTTNQLKANTEAIRENLSALKSLSTEQFKNNLDKNRQELHSFKHDMQSVFKGIDREFKRTFDFRSVLQKGLDDTAKQIQKTVQQSVMQAISQSIGGKGGLLGNLLQAPLSGLFRSSQGQSAADATRALMKGRRNL